MTPRPPLAVLLDGRRVAVLNDAGEGASMTYTEEALDVFGTDRAVLSVTLPTRSVPYPSVATQAFLDGVLPEGWARDRLAAIARTAENDTFGLLEAFGRECAGAITILPDGDSVDRREPGVEWLDESGLAAVVRDLAVAPFGDDPRRGVRVSLGGVQEKVAVVVEGTNIGLPVGTTPSTHILKPVPLDADGAERWPGMAQLEVFCLNLAAAVGEASGTSGVSFRAAPARITRVGARPAVLVTRYDRRLDAGGVRRVHQEDGCQAMRLAPTGKYQQRRDQPPSLAALAAILDRWGSDPITDKRGLIQMVMLSVVIGNADLHAKNISLLGHPVIRLAPVYDLVSTTSYAGLDDELGMYIGNALDLDAVAAGDLKGEAISWGLGPRAVTTALALLAEAVLERVDSTADDPELSHPVVAAAAESARSRASKLLGELRR